MWRLLCALFGQCPDVGSAVIEDGRLKAWNDHPFPVLSASKIIPAAMAIEQRRTDLSPLVRLSVVNSDNAAADRLTARLGGKVAVSRWLASKRLPATFATEAEMIANPTVYQLRPSELAMILYRIKSPELLSLMAQTKTGNDRIRAAYPKAPHKSGTLGSNLVDVGVVGGSVVAVMGSNAAPGDLATESSRLGPD